MSATIATVKLVHKPWGVYDMRPWSDKDVPQNDPVGELWFELNGKRPTQPALLLKLLFTCEPLSIQVHPDDTYARAMGLPCGKSEAWYILSAKPGAQVGIGLTHEVTSQQLRNSIENGSIADLICWQSVAENDVIYVPAGTIHAIGAGIVLAEIQQFSDITFRLFDYGRQRKLHVEDSIAVAHPWPLERQCKPEQFTKERTILVASKHFVFERFELPKSSSWALAASCEMHVLVLSGHASIGLIPASIGQVVNIGNGRNSLEVGANGLTLLVAYADSTPNISLLQSLDEHPSDIRPCAFTSFAESNEVQI